MSHTDSKHSEHAPAVDRELNTRAIVQSVVGLAVVVVVSMFLMRWMMGSMERARQAGDPPPSPLAEANAPWDPPGPNLQEYPPTVDIDQLRGRDEAILGSYGWVDETAGVVRIPIDQAIDVLAETGLPEPADVETLSEEIFGGVAAAGGGEEAP